MSSKRNHKTRSRKTYKARMAAARSACNYCTTREMKAFMQAMLRPSRYQDNKQ